VAVATTHRGAGASVRRDAAAPWRHVDLSLVLAVLATAGIGLALVYSATHKRAEVGLDPYTFLERQGVFVAVGVLVMVAVMAVDYRVVRDFAAVAYGGTLVVLAAVLSPLGSTSKGTQAWFQLGSFQLQPSEFAKVTIILSVAAYAAAHRGELDARRVVAMVGIVAVPAGLIYLQPDFGTALVFAAVAAGVLVVGGARPRHLAVLALVGALAVGGAMRLGLVTLADYQRDRLTAFLDPSRDTRRSAYNLNQSKIAIGSGGLTGKGYLRGPQTNLSYVPEQHTDFIFTVAGEELGFVGAGGILLLLGWIMWRTWRTAVLAKDLFGTLVCVGVLSMLAFQVFENVGMTMGIMPITGIPLPLLSYGGSSTVATFAAIGLVLNVHMRRFS
jgi:rod shape determining protein RodA